MEAVLGRDGAGMLGMAADRAINNGRNVQALKVKAPATPMAPMIAAANIGPQSLAILNWTELSARARSNSARGTRLGTTARKTGPFRAHTMPSRNVKAITTHGVARPRNAATASPVPRAHAAVCRIMIQALRFTRSAT